jgi:(R)-2-hydroxyacyl-CoA dehydratese activating ATPase
MPYFMGIDIGTGTSKGIIIRDGKIFMDHTLPTGINYEKTAHTLLEELLGKSGISLANIRYSVATGQGATSAGYCNESIGDIRCCAKGVFNLFPEARTIIDIEGQTTQVIRLGKAGQIANFVTSEKCASGSGRFLDIISNVLQIPLENIGPLSLKSQNPVRFTTACAVFGESEAVSRVAEGVPAADILAGVHQSIAEKISTMVDRVGMEEAIVVCGGGGLNTGLVKMLESVLKLPLLVPPQPQMVTVLGAALLAQDAAGTTQIIGINKGRE